MNGCCWLNHNDPIASKRYINTVRANPQIKGWFSGHFHLSHDYEVGPIPLSTCSAHPPDRHLLPTSPPDAHAL